MLKMELSIGNNQMNRNLVLQFIQVYDNVI